ncbi:MAG TPA: hypothetical protein VGE72_23005 [Azospirillum sp.]
MLKLPLPSLMDAVRLLRNDVDEAAFAYREWLKAKDDINFSYGPSLRTVKPVFAGIELAMALKSLEKCPEKWRKANAEVIGLVCAEADKRKHENGKPLTCLDTPCRKFVVRPDIRFSVRPSVLYVLKKKAEVLWVQPRKKHGLNHNQIATLMAIANHTFIPEDLPEDAADIEFLDLSVDETERRAVATYRLSDFKLPDIAAIERHFDIFAKGYDQVCTEGFEIHKKPRKRPEDRPPTLL